MGYIVVAGMIRRIIKSWWLSLPVWACVGVWYFAPLAVLHIEAIEVSGGRAIVSRTFPLDRFGLPRPLVETHQEVRRLTSERNILVCTRDTYFRFSHEDRVVEWALEPWSDLCRVRPYRWEATWTVWLGGRFPLRPITRSVTVLDPVEE